MVYWRGNSAENQDTNGKLGPKPYRERYHPRMDEQCGHHIGNGTIQEWMNSADGVDG